MDTEKLTSVIRNGQKALSIDGNPTNEKAEARADNTMRLIEQACQASMPRKRPYTRREATYWWNAEIAEIRKKCLWLRCRAQRKKKRKPAEAAERAAEYLQAKKVLNKAIKESKNCKWQDLRKEVNNDPWGLGYRIVTRKLGNFMLDGAQDAETMDSIVNTLFPAHPLRREETWEDGMEEIPLFSEAELIQAVKTLQNRKAPVPDGIPSEVLKVVAQTNPGVLLNMYNSCLKEGCFPKRWKRQRLVLIYKGKGDQNLPSSYRPLCMLDTAGKLLEKLLKPRLQAAIKAAGDLSDRQYGFRKGRSTVEAISDVVTAVHAAQRGNNFSRKIVLLVTLDVKNAFNSVRWKNILETLQTRFQVPQYLLRMVKHYLWDRVLLYDTKEASREKTVTAGAAQGSILGPDLWNASYDGILRMEMPDGAFLVGYADDIAAVIEARDLERAQMKLNQVMRRVFGWMKDHDLDLAVHKTEILIMTTKRIDTVIQMQVGTDSNEEIGQAP